MDISIRVWVSGDFCEEERKVWARNFKRDRSRGAWHVTSPNMDSFFYPYPLLLSESKLSEVSA